MGRTTRVIDFLRRQGYSNDEIMSRLKSNLNMMRMRKNQKR